MRFPVVLIFTVISSLVVTAGEFRIQSAATNGAITWSGAYTAGVCNVQTAPMPSGPWTPRKNLFTSNELGGASVPLLGGNTFFRLLSVDISTNSPRHYTNLLESYGILETVAGSGQSNTDTSHWLPSYEGAWATNVSLSRPHIAFGDAAGNVLIVDQRSSSVLKVTPEGRLYTYAGTHGTNFNGDGPAPATNLTLCNPTAAGCAPTARSTCSTPPTPKCAASIPTKS